jgi:hypothetical protein
MSSATVVLEDAPIVTSPELIEPRFNIHSHNEPTRGLFHLHDPPVSASKCHSKFQVPRAGYELSSH